MRDTPKPHLLYLAIGFPPAAKSCAYRMRATANLFCALGWDVTVVTLEPASWHREYGLDPTLAALVDPRVKVVELPLARVDLDPDISGYSWLRARFPVRWVKWRHQLDTVAFPERIFGSWRPALEQAAAAVHREHPVDLTLVSPSPYVMLAAAVHLQERHGVPYAVDYRDAWSLDVLAGQAAFPVASRRGRWEAKVISGARAVWTVNEPIRDFYRERYPAQADRLWIARNGFDADLGEDLSVTRLPDLDAGLTFGYLGTVNLHPDQVKAILDGWCAGQARDELLARSRLVFRGHLGAGMVRSANASAALIAKHAADGVSYGGPVAKSDVPALYRSWDALVLALAGGRYVTSGKVYEYMATGLPVVSAHEQPHAAADVLSGYPLWVPTETVTEAAMADAFVRAAQSAATADAGQRSLAREYAARFERSLQLEPEVRRLAGTVTADRSADRRTARTEGHNLEVAP